MMHIIERKNNYLYELLFLSEKKDKDKILGEVQKYLNKKSIIDISDFDAKVAYRIRKISDPIYFIIKFLCERKDANKLIKEALFNLGKRNSFRFTLINLSTTQDRIKKNVK